MTTQTMGENGFRWFIGTVVDRTTDPLELGRLKVRIYGIHDDVTNTPNNELPWATIVNLPISASANQVGITPLGIMEGSTVVGFFADGAEGQLPMILGTIAAIPENNDAKHDVAKLARSPARRGENDLLNQKNSQRLSGQLVNEPPSAYKARYPYNKVIRTEKNHTIEIDDTPNEERLHIFHKSGTFTEIDKNGTSVHRVVGNNYTVVVKNNNTLVGSNCVVEVTGSVNVLVKGTANVRVNGECKMSSGGLFTIASDSRIVLDAPRIDLNPTRSGTISEPPKSYIPVTTSSPTPPPGPNNGDQWFDTTSGKTKVWNEVNPSFGFWVDA